MGELPGLIVAFVLGGVVLAAGIQLRETTWRWLDRRRRRRVRRLSVVVLVDRGFSWRRRRCFWKAFRRGSPDIDIRCQTKIRYVSVPSELDRHRNPATRLFSEKHTDVLVVNWDAANGDPVYGADRTRSFLDHYRPDMLNWLRKGGTLIVESQGASWAPSQLAYECFTDLFPESYVHVHPPTSWDHGDEIRVHPDEPGCLANPELEEKDLRLDDAALGNRYPWFPRLSAGATIQSLHYAARHNHLYRGWFAQWSPDWTPALSPARSEETDPSASAVLLYQHVGPDLDGPAAERGVVVLTTLFLAAAELSSVVKNLLRLRNRRPSAVNRSAGRQPSA